MKRITLLALLAVALMVVAFPAMAATGFAWSGEITSVFQTDFSSAKELVSTANVTLGVTINPILSFTGLIISTTNAAAGSTGGMLFNGNGAYYATVDLGKVFGVDAKTLTETLSIGNVAPGGTTESVTGFASEGLMNSLMTAGKVSIISTTGIMGLANLYVAVDPASLFGGTAQWLADVYGSFGPVNASVAIASNSVENLALSFSQAFGDVAFGVAAAESYNLTSGAVNPLNLGFGLKAAYKTLVTFGVCTTYGASLGAININLNVAPAATWGLDLWASVPTTGFATAGYIDASAWTKLDASTLRLGYVYTNSTGGYNVAQVADGGLYFLYDLTF